MGNRWCDVLFARRTSRMDDPSPQALRVAGHSPRRDEPRLEPLLLSHGVNHCHPASAHGGKQRCDQPEYQRHHDEDD